MKLGIEKRKLEMLEQEATIKLKKLIGETKHKHLNVE